MHVLHSIDESNASLGEERLLRDMAIDRGSQPYLPQTT
jgi:hypothetical protein